MPISDCFRTAPHEWLHQLVRRKAVIIMVIQAFDSLVSGLPGYQFEAFICGEIMPRHFETSLNQAYLTIGVVWFFVAIACLADGVPKWALEVAVCSGHIAYQTLAIWDSPATCTWSALIIRSAALVFCGVRPMPFFFTISADTFNLIASHALIDHCSTSRFALGFANMSATLLVCYFCLHNHWIKLCEAQGQLATEKKGLQRLLNMVCDAACWVEPHTGLIVRSDQRLDAMMGQQMAGRQLGLHMPTEESERFAACIAGKTAEILDTPVELVRSKIITQDGHHFEVELFIADLRVASAGANPQGGLAGFLIGIRLAHQRNDRNDSSVGLEDAEIWADQSPASVAAFGMDTEADSSGQPLSEENVAKLTEVSSVSGSTAPSAQFARSLCAASLPETLRSAALPDPHLHVCSRSELEAAIAGAAGLAHFPRVACSETRHTLLEAMALLLDHAAGGALLCVADAEAFRRVFDSGVPGRPTAQACDSGYMTDRLRGKHISDPCFAAAFHAFTQHADNDRWPLDHEDARARGRPKDGAFLVSRTGYRIKCAAKLLGLAPAATWANMGTKHAAALACAWEVPGCFVFIRSDGGARHVVVRWRGSLHVYDVRESV